MRAFLVAAAVVGIVAAAADVAFTQAKPSTAPSLEGVWKGVSVVVTGAGASTNPSRLPSILIYTKKHFSLLTQDAAVPRPPRKAPPAPKDPNKLTDAEKIALYELWLPLNAASGTYELKGTTLTHHQIASKGIPVDQTFEMKIESNTFVQTTKSAAGQPASETRRTFTRLE